MRLKACPFCGGTASLNSRGGKYGRFVFAACDMCGARAKTCSCDICRNGNTECDWKGISCKYAINAWNRRIDDGKEDS